MACIYAHTIYTMYTFVLAQWSLALALHISHVELFSRPHHKNDQAFDLLPKLERRNGTSEALQFFFRSLTLTRTRTEYLSGTSVPCQHGAFSHFFRLFSTFGLMHQNVVTLGGYVYAFRNPFQKCMGWGGIGDHIFEYRGRTFRRFRVFGPQGAPLTRAGHQLTGLPLGAPTYCGVGAK